MTCVVGSVPYQLPDMHIQHDGWNDDVWYLQSGVHQPTQRRTVLPYVHQHPLALHTAAAAAADATRKRIRGTCTLLKLLKLFCVE